ncbi:MAG TPA: Maf family protein [Candidatus Acidoferrales bacterium]|jgi:septum formation protein|nr:Maf family protein [Candidatus Acidoferrales bacterium]
MKLILASGSPRRAEILRNAGFAFEVLPANVDESRLPDEPAADYVLRLARAKARIAAQQVPAESEPSICIGADTTVVLEKHLLGKPESIEEARWMLRELSAQTHEVLTGIALVTTPDFREISHLERTKVTFAELSESEIESYLASGEPFDKAGAYGIQGLAGKYVTRIEGCYFNVMGLPLSRLWRMLRDLSLGEAGLGRE